MSRYRLSTVYEQCGSNLGQVQILGACPLLPRTEDWIFYQPHSHMRLCEWLKPTRRFRDCPTHQHGPCTSRARISAETRRPIDALSGRPFTPFQPVVGGGGNVETVTAAVRAADTKSPSIGGCSPAAEILATGSVKSSSDALSFMKPVRPSRIRMKLNRRRQQVCSVLVILRRKCTLAASRTAPPGESRWVCAAL